MEAMGTALEAASARGAPASSGIAVTGYRSNYYDERCKSSFLHLLRHRFTTQSDFSDSIEDEFSEVSYLQAKPKQHQRRARWPIDMLWPASIIIPRTCLERGDRLR